MITKANVSIPKPTKAQLRRIKLVEKKIKNSITVRELITKLSAYPADAKVSFGGLDFHRLHQRENFIQVEFRQAVYLNRRGRVVIKEIPKE